MADVNKTVSINYKASTEQLEQKLKKIPGITDREMNEAVRKMDGNFKKMEKSADSSSQKMGAAMKKVGAGIAAVGAAAVVAGGALLAMTQKMADSTNELVDASTKTGIAVDTLAGLRLAAEGSGLEFSNLEGGLIKFQGSMQAASRGSKQMSDTFKQLGIEVKNSDGSLKDANDVFNETIAALGDMENLTERNAIAMQLFGRQSGPALIQSGALDNLDGMKTLATEFGIAVTDDAIPAMGDFQRKMAEFNTVALGTMQNVIDAVAGPNGLNKALKFASEGVVYFGVIFGDVIAAVSSTFSYLFSRIQAVGLALTGDFAGAIKVYTDSTIKATVAIDNLGNTFSRAQDKLNRFRTVSAQSTQTTRKGMQEGTEATEDFGDGVEGATRKIGKMKTAIEEVNQLQKLQDDLFESSGKLIEENMKLNEKSLDFRRDQLIPSYDKEVLKLREIAQEIKTQLWSMGLTRDERQSELDILEEQYKNIDRNGQLTEQQIQDLQMIEELRGNIMFLTNEMNDLEEVYNQQRIVEAYAIAEVRKEQLNDQIEQERQQHEDRKAQIMEQIDLFNTMGDNVMTTFQSISQAVNDVAENQIEQLREQTDARIESVSNYEKQGLISSELATKQREQIEQQYLEKIQKFKERQFKANQAAAISDVIFQGAIASARAFADYGLPAGLAVSALTAAQTAAQLVSIRAQTPPKFDVGGMVGNVTENAPDQVRANLLTGEAVLDRATVKRIGGEEGVKRLQQGQSSGDRVIIIQPFKHFDRFAGSMGMQRKPVTGIGGY